MANRIKLVFTLVLMSITTLTQANICQPQDNCETYKFWIDALYWHPSSCPLNYVIKDSTFQMRIDNEDEPFEVEVMPLGKERGRNLDYHWGFRIGAVRNSPCSALDQQLFYSRLNAEDEQKTTAKRHEALWPTYLPAEMVSFSDLGVLVPSPLFDTFAKSKTNIRWNAVDGEIGYNLTNLCSFALRGHFGLHWTDLCVHRRVFYQGKPDGEQDQYISKFSSTAKTWGIGPRIGIDISYCTPFRVNCNAKVGYGVLTGQMCDRINGSVEEIDSVNQTIDGTQVIKVKSRRQNRVFPEFDAAISLSYNCRNFTCELGWEWRTYTNAVTEAFFPATSSALTIKQCDSLNLQGLYIRGMLQF